MVGVTKLDPKTIIATQMEKVLKLMEQKDKLISEIYSFQYILCQNHVSMQEPLVDAQGFPRNDIDVARIRHARHSIIRLRNDLKAVMKSVEENLHIVHDIARNNGSNANNDVNDERANLEPIARIKSVAKTSPAFISGLKNEDLVIEFGSVNFTNFKSLDDITRVISHSIHCIINILIQRGNQRIPLKLRPRRWSGRGFLGCLILPIENIER